MRVTRTTSVLVLAGALALGAAACGDDADPVGETDEMTDEMTEEMTEEMTDEMTDEMTEDMTEDMTEEMTDGDG